MLDEIQSTDVGSDSPSAVAPESTGAGASSVATSGEATQATAPGGDTAQLGQAEQVEQVETVDSASEPDPLEGVPSIDELKQNPNQQYAKALLQLREAYEARKSEVSELQGKLNPLNPAIERHGDTETVQSRLETFDQIFTPVVDPQTQETVIDPNTGLPDYNPLPFIQSVDTENPGFAEKMLSTLLRAEYDYGDGERTPLHKLDPVREIVLKGCGLDPARLADYQNIDALSAPTGVTPEELQSISPDRQEAYKTLPQSLRNAWETIPEDERAYHLDTAQERLDAKQFREQQTEQQRQAREQQETQLRAQVSEAQDSFVSQQILEGHTSIMDSLASQITFPEEVAPAIHSSISALLFSLRDPDYRQANSQKLEAMGIKLDSDFDQALAAADKHLRNAKAYEMFGQKGQQQASLAEARNAKNQVLAKLAPIALKAAKAMGGQLAANAQEQGKLLQDASSVRPIPRNGNQVAEQNSYLPPGMRANDPQAGVYLARQMGLLR